MKNLPILILVAAVHVGVSNPLWSADEHVSHSAVRTAVQKSLPYIAERGQWWIDAKKCVTCHRVAFTVWAHVSAAEANMDVDKQQIHAWIDWSFTSMLEKNDKGIVAGTTNLDGVAQMVFATRGTQLTEVQQAQRTQLLRLLEEGQQPDGSWKPAGQLPSQKRPSEETVYVTTGWNRLLGQPMGLSADASENALSFLRSDVELISTESLVVRVLGSADEVSKGRAVEALLDEQNQDGGWGWIRRQESDAMATGQVLFALSSMADSEAVRSQISAAQSWLVATQTQDGSWAVKGTKKKKQNSVEETATYWGTCWSAIGLLESIKAGHN